MSEPVVLSHYQARPALAAWAAGTRALALSLDLGLSAVGVALEDGGVRLPDGALLGWAALEAIADDENGCYAVWAGEPTKIARFSPATNRLISLMPTAGAPTMLLSGIPMHRIKGTDPMRDTRAKIAALGPVWGQVLDTATGLGYTAIAAAETAAQVVTIELDPAVLAVCRQNPWSRALFGNPRIEQLEGDAAAIVPTLGSGRFDCIIHDPPTFSLAGELYSAAFYGALLGVLRPGGRLFHYIGNPERRSGRNVTRGVIERLQRAGFRRVARRPQAFGVVAVH